MEGHLSRLHRAFLTQWPCKLEGRNTSSCKKRARGGFWARISLLALQTLNPSPCQALWTASSRFGSIPRPSMFDVSNRALQHFFRRSDPDDSKIGAVSLDLFSMFSRFLGFQEVLENIFFGQLSSRASKCAKICLLRRTDCCFLAVSVPDFD